MTVSYQFMQNHLIQFDERLEVDDVKNIVTSDETGKSTLGYSIARIDREKIFKLKDFINKIDKNWIKEKRIPNNMTLEKVSYDLYQTTKYWDVILLLNERTPIWDMPYDYDVISEAGNTAINEFETEFYGKKVTERVMWDGVSTRDRIKNAYQEEASENNNLYCQIKYIDPNHIYDFINLMYDEDMM